MMISVDPNMDVRKQNRYADAAINAALDEGDIQKAQYIAQLKLDMNRSVRMNTPRPWSEFAPMIEEEFGNE